MCSNEEKCLFSVWYLGRENSEARIAYKRIFASLHFFTAWQPQDSQHQCPRGNSAEAALPLLTQPQKSQSITFLHPVGYELLKPIHIQGGGHSPPPTSHVSPFHGGSVEDFQVFSEPPCPLFFVKQSRSLSHTHMHKIESESDQGSRSYFQCMVNIQESFQSAEVRLWKTLQDRRSVFSTKKIRRIKRAGRRIYRLKEISEAYQSTQCMKSHCMIPKIMNKKDREIRTLRNSIRDIAIKEFFFQV